MEYSIIYKINNTNDGIYLLPMDFTIVRKERNNKLKVTIGNFKDLVVDDFEKNPIEETAEFTGMVFKEKTLEETYHTTNYEDLKQIINLEDYIFKIDEKGIKLTTFEELSLSEIKSNILGQDKQIDELFGAILYNQKLYDSKLNNNDYSKLKKSILISGPTGVGKTESIKKITETLNIPTLYVDLTNYIYKGMENEDTTAILLRLLKESDYDVEKCESGVIIFDNFDKLTDLMDTVNQKLYTDFILKTIATFNDDSYIEISREGYEPIEFHKDCLTLVFVGDFDKLLKTQDKLLGYRKEELNKSFREKHKNNTYINEILECITNIIEFNDLTKEDMMNILLKSKQSPLYLKSKFYHELGKKLSFDESYLKDIVDKAYELKEGAKGLKYLTEESLNKEELNMLLDKTNGLTIKKDETIKKVRVRKINKQDLEK